MERMLEDARESARQEAAAELHEEMEAMRADQAPQIMPDPFQASGLGSPQPPPQVVQIHQEPSPEVASNAVSEGLAPPDEGFQIVSQAAGDPPVSTAMDSNLVTNLMRWVGDVKRRMGASQFEGFLEVYKLTGHLPPVVEKVILQLATLDALPDESADQVFTLDDLMDSLLQLHAIIYGPGYASRGSLENLLEGNGEGSHLDG